jgi:hypothetical protein
MGLLALPDENGSRAEVFGSNPLSNGDLFYQSPLFFFILHLLGSLPTY